MDFGNGLSLELGKYQPLVDARLQQLENEHFGERLWKKDSRLWIREENKNSETPMGWLTVVDKMMEDLPRIEKFVKNIHDAGFNHVVLLGMGGSSLAPFVFQETFKNSLGKIRFTVVDTTEPETIKKIKNEINIATLFIVSSKSGSTAEVIALYRYFRSFIAQLKKSKAGENFIAITDEGSSLADLAKKENFRETFINLPEIGGRYSALSYFGIIPAALIGINIQLLLERSRSMMNSCGPAIPVSKNPGIVLGVALAELALQGRDKLTYLIQPELSSFGSWLEQLVAESTGKNGKGILPIDSNALCELELYGPDTVFLQFSFPQKTKDLKKIASHYPFIKIVMEDLHDLGMEFFRWEIATATAGAILGINPFDQPNVEESKKCTTELLHQISLEGKLPPMEVCLIENSVRYYCAQKAGSARLLMDNFFASSKPNDFIVLQAYLPETSKISNCLAQIKYALQRSLKLAVSIQFGPRYLHSTGQYHKGGPNNGFFIQFISSSEDEIQIPGHDYTFGLLKKAQAIGDREALIKYKRNCILVDLGKTTYESLDAFKETVEKIKSIEERSQKNIYAYNDSEEAFEVTAGLIAKTQNLNKEDSLNPTN
ncbi:MAG TPA: hypothetical protein VGC65_04550 [Bacteroidia bacterium]|jgi:glucose-6-phosphate isomerase